MAALLMAGAAIFTACSSDDAVVEQTPEQSADKTYTLTVQASKGMGTRALTLDETTTPNTLNATWKTDENVYVMKVVESATRAGAPTGVKTITWADGSLSPQAVGTTATLTGSLSGYTIEADDELTLQFPRGGNGIIDLDYRGQDGTLEKIASDYDYATAKITVANVDNGGNITTENDPVDFTNQQAIVRFTLLDKAGNAINPTELTVSPAVATASYQDNYSLQNNGTTNLIITPDGSTNVVYAALRGVDNRDLTLTATVGDNTYTYEKSGVTFTHGKFYDIAVKMNAATPLTMEATTAGTIVVKNPRSGMKYSLNGGDKTTMTETTTIDVAKGDKVQFYGDGTSINKYYYDWSYTNIAGGSAEVKVYGNIMSLVDETGYASNTKLTGEYAFQYLFKENTTLTDASGLLLPATTLTMACYDGMFSGCSSLITAPALPTTTLTAGCYSNMFSGCSRLITAPALPATTLTAGCYSNMFLDCSRLTTAPVLPAKTLANYCYNCMFSGCSSLNSVTCLATDNNAYESTSYWLDGVASSGTFTKAKNVSWVTASHGIPYGWTVVEAE